MLTSLVASVRQWSAACHCVHFPVQWFWNVSSTLSFFYTLCDCELLTEGRHLDELPDGQLQKVMKV